MHERKREVKAAKKQERVDKQAALLTAPEEDLPEKKKKKDKSKR